MFGEKGFVVSPPTTEPQEVWQWQINCVSRRYNLFHRPMPQNFGMLIGREADAEARLKASVSWDRATKRKKMNRGMTAL